MNCPECGSSLIDGEICTYCGHEIEFYEKISAEKLWKAVDEWDGEVPF